MFNKNGTPIKPFNEHGAQVVTEMQVGEYNLHGDIIVQRIADLPAEFNTAPTEPNSALGYGESAMHVHQLQGTPGVDFEAKVLPTGERLLKIVNPTALKHQEHSPIVLPPGMYRTGQQLEYDPFSKRTRQVID